MKVLLVSPFFYPETTGISVTAPDCARFLRDLGHDVTILTGLPFFPQWRVYEGYRGIVRRTERFEGMTLERGWVYVPRRDHLLGRVLHELSFTVSIALRSLLHDADLVVCISPHMTTATTLALLSRVIARRSWTYVQDLQTDIAIELGMLKSRVGVRVARALERLMYRFSDKVLVLSPAMLARVARCSPVGADICLVPPAIDVDAFRAGVDAGRGRFFSKSTRTSRTQGSPTDAFVAVHSGSLSPKYDFDGLLDCSQHLVAASGVELVIVGEGSVETEAFLRTQVAKRRLDNVRLLPLCPRPQFADMLASADVLLVAMKKSMIDLNLPSKILSYMAAGRPIVVAADVSSEVARLTAVHRIGLVVPPEDPAALAAAILRLRADPDLCAELGRNALAHVRASYDRDAVRARYYAPLFGEGQPAAPAPPKGAIPLALASQRSR